MRAHPTLSEAKLWQALRGSALGVAFRRQAVVGERIVDFVARPARLIVEVDGGYHAERARADARRERELEAAGYRVLRALPSVLAVIGAACAARRR
jgi:very-short-patch-repair endonuclease